MCGIFGAIATENVVPTLMRGLGVLQYRGYDSAGIAIMVDERISRRRSEGKLQRLEADLRTRPLSGSIGIAHTRWATHGQPTVSNAHPHATENVAVVHNGIIENHGTLRHELGASGYRFTSQTDSEVVPMLVDQYMARGLDPIEAVRAAVRRLEGAYALSFLFKGEGERLIAARCGSPLIVGEGAGGGFLSSDMLALAGSASKHCFLEDGDVAEVTRHGITVINDKGRRADRTLVAVGSEVQTTKKGVYTHHMLKEIHEQPQIVEEAWRNRWPSAISPCTGKSSHDPLSNPERICFVACGTSFYAGQVAQLWAESFAQLPSEVHLASEFRHREIPLPLNTLCIFVSQSGETADTLAAMTAARARGLASLAVVNVAHSTMARGADEVLLTNAGPEIGVASTKAFTAQLLALLGLIVKIAVRNGRMKAREYAELTGSLGALPSLQRAILEHRTPLQPAVRCLKNARHALFLGRGLGYPLALEGALKLKEISYVHAEGYAAGELKHGPLALVDDDMPVVVLAPKDDLFQKTMANAQEVAARGAQIILLTDASPADCDLGDVEAVISLPSVDQRLMPLLYALPLQLLAYEVAGALGRDIDQPRNLAKSVTVE